MEEVIRIPGTDPESSRDRNIILVGKSQLRQHVPYAKSRLVT